MKHALAITTDSFELTGIGIILEIKHSENGLPKNTELSSKTSDRIWKVRARVLFDHAISEQKIFEIESTEYMLMKFKSQEKKQQSINAIKERESKHIFQYFTSPVGHSEKPKTEELLKINLP